MQISYRNIFNIIAYFFSFFIILNGTSIWMSNSLFKNIYLIMILILGLVIFIYNVIIPRPKKKSIKRSILLIFYLVYICIFIMFNRYNLKGIINDLVFIFISLYSFNIICEDYKIDVFSKFNNIISIIIYLSLFMYIFGTTLKIIPISHYAKVDWGSIFYKGSYMGLHYDMQTYIFFNNVIYRNSSIFFEAGIFSFFINYCIIFELFYKQNIKYKKIILLIIAQITTFSTAGIVIMIIILWYFYITNKNINEIAKLIKNISIPIISIIFLIIIMFTINEKIDNKYGVNSFNLRTTEIELSMELFKEKKIFGWGYKNSNALMNIRPSDVDNGGKSGGSNGWLLILYQNGLFILLMYLVCVIKNRKIIKKNNKNFANVFTFFIVINLAFIPIPYTTFYIFILARSMI